MLTPFPCLVEFPSPFMAFVLPGTIKIPSGCSLLEVDDSDAAVLVACTRS